MMTGSEIIIRALEAHHITTISGIPGGAVLPFYNALYQSSITHILTRHEQGAAFIAQGMARTSGKAGVCIATSGPGATNLLTGIADAYMDSIPLIAITGQVVQHKLGTMAFQEINTAAMASPITKKVFTPTSAAELQQMFFNAFFLAHSGRPGPVLIDISTDIFLDHAEWNMSMKPLTEKKQTLDDDHIERIAHTINNAKRPLLFIGGGCQSTETATLINKLANKADLPVIATMMGLGAISTHNKRFIGMTGTHGPRYMRSIIEQADCICAISTRFSERAMSSATGTISDFAPQATIIHIDIAACDNNPLLPHALTLQSSACNALTALMPKITMQQRSTWWSILNRTMTEQPEAEGPMNALIRTLGTMIPAGATIVTDVGQHQMWTAQSFPFIRPRQFLTSGGLGTMGFGLPAAIGAYCATGQKTFLITGDGSLLMNIQELATLKETGADVTIIILNNHHLGLVRQQQELFYNQNYSACALSYATDFCVIAQGFGIPSMRIEQNALTTITEIATDTISAAGARVIDMTINPEELVLPMTLPGKKTHWRTPTHASEMCAQL